MKQTEGAGGDQYQCPPEKILSYLFSSWIFFNYYWKKLVSQWKCAKSFPSRVFIGLSTDSQFRVREWQTSKRSKTLPASNEWESVSSFSYYSVKWHQGVTCLVVLGQFPELKVTSFLWTHDVERPTASGIQDEMNQPRGIWQLFASCADGTWFHTD